MALVWTNTEQMNLRNGIKSCVYSTAGIGKTVLCATAPRPILISAESGVLSLARKNLERLYGVGNPNITYNIPAIEITTLQDLIDAHRWLQSSHEAKQFDTACIDSGSEIAEKVLANAKAQVKDPRQAYGELIEKMQNTIRSFRDLPEKHVYIAFKQEAIKDEMSGVVSNGPSMPGNKLGQQIPYFFDFVFRLGVNKDQQGVSYRFLQTEADIQNVAKDRSGALNPVEPAHLGYIFNKVMQSA